jgi:hypothetical protein
MNLAISCNAALKRDGAPFSRLRHQPASLNAAATRTLKGKPRKSNQPELTQGKP